MLRALPLAPVLVAALGVTGCSGGSRAAGDGGAAKHLEPSAIPVAATYLRLVHRHECAAAARLADQDDGSCLQELGDDLERRGATWTVRRGRIHRDCPIYPTVLQAVKGYECARFDAITRD